MELRPFESVRRSNESNEERGLVKKQVKFQVLHGRICPSLPAVTFDGVPNERRKELGAQNIHPLTGWDEQNHPTL